MGSYIRRIGDVEESQPCQLGGGGDHRQKVPYEQRMQPSCMYACKFNLDHLQMCAKLQPFTQAHSIMTPVPP